jgi:hypothetical protein
VGDWPVREPSGGKLARLARVGGRVALVLTAVLLVLAGYASSRPKGLFDCDSPWPERLFIPAGVMFYLGVLLIIAGLVRAGRSRSWANARVAVTGFYLIFCTVAFGVFIFTAVPTPMCG